MHPDSEAPQSSPNSSPDFTEVESSLAEAEEMLSEIRDRYRQVRDAQTQRQELEQQLATLQGDLDSVKSKLAQTWETLESQLITWKDREELFWQFLRFAGLGFAIALLLNWAISNAG